MRILELGTDNRPLIAEWISVSRVTRTLDALGHNVRYYSVDGNRVPENGLGSLIKGGVGTLELFDSRLTSSGSDPIVLQIIPLALANEGTCIACALVTEDKPK